MLITLRKNSITNEVFAPLNFILEIPYQSCLTAKMPYATIKDRKIHYFDSSVLHQPQNAKVPILMVHGLGSSQNYWMPVISKISPKFRCIALDSYGAGRSKSNGEKVTLDGIAEDVVALLDSLKIEKAVIAGHSMGGTITCIVASRFPERVLGIVPVGPVNPGSVKAEVFSSRIETVLKSKCSK
jgi:pimeloyl-ACP methyl ester carboxylesterase